MRGRLMVAGFGLVVGLGGCDLWAPAVPDASGAPQIRFGTVRWETVVSDCRDNAWSADESAMALIEGDKVTLWFDTMPELTGTLTADGHADMAGSMTFPGDTGATVSCVVDGTAAVAGPQVTGDMHEVLSSVGDLNCDSRGRYTIDLSE